MEAAAAGSSAGSRSGSGPAPAALPPLDAESRELLEAWRDRVSCELDTVIDFWIRHSHDPEHGWVSGVRQLVRTLSPAQQGSQEAETPLSPLRSSAGADPAFGILLPNSGKNPGVRDSQALAQEGTQRSWSPTPRPLKRGRKPRLPDPLRPTPSTRRNPSVLETPTSMGRNPGVRDPPPATLLPGWEGA